MEIDIKKIQIQNTTKCKCGHEFTLKNIKGIETIDNKGFYGNIIKDVSHVKCPDCGTDTLLLLRQKGQTWEILDTATFKDEQKDNTQTPETINKVKEIESQEFICPTCKKVCKSQIGLNSHIKTHQN